MPQNPGCFAAIKWCAVELQPSQTAWSQTAQAVKLLQSFSKSSDNETSVYIRHVTGMQGNKCLNVSEKQ